MRTRQEKKGKTQNRICLGMVCISRRGGDSISIIVAIAIVIDSSNSNSNR
jgi:hypothetical protein